jgi:hypothetical protein
MVSPNPLTRELLASGRADRPSDNARRNAAIAIGIAATAATTATAGGAAAGTATGTVAASKWLGGLGLLKVVGATVVSGAVVVGVARDQGYFAPLPTPAPSANVSSAPAHARAPGPKRSAPVTPPQVTLSEATPPEVTPPEATPPESSAPEAKAQEAETRAEIPSPAPVTAGIPSPSLPSPPVVHRPSPPVRTREEASLRDEVERLDRARAALAQERPVTGLAELDAYDGAFRNGALREEAELLRIETLAKMGECGAARLRAQRLLARDEHGPLARRVRALLTSLSRSAGGH